MCMYTSDRNKYDEFYLTDSSGCDMIIRYYVFPISND